MSRVARKKSPTNIYHVMFRGINRQCIFEEEADYKEFLSLLSKSKEASGFLLYAFCLMENHVHLLLEPQNEPLETVVKRILCSFVLWYNAKYQRVGHLFQDRYRSEIIENEASFLNAFQYIHQNPIKARVVNSPSAYPWSSYSYYSHPGRSLVDVEKASLAFSSREELLAYLNSYHKTWAAEDADFYRHNDLQAKKLIYQISHCHNVSEFQSLKKQQRNIYVSELKQAGLTLRQIERLCGISKSTAARL